MKFVKIANYFVVLTPNKQLSTIYLTTFLKIVNRILIALPYLLLFMQGSNLSTTSNALAAMNSKPRSHSINYVSSDYEVRYNRCIVMIFNIFNKTINSYVFRVWIMIITKVNLLLEKKN